MAQSVAARPAARRSRQSLKEDGDRSHIPREERSYLEYHPTLQTSVALTLVRQASQAIRHHSRQPSQLPPYPLHSRQNSIREVRHEVADGFNQANGTQSPPTSGSVASADTADSRRDDFLAFGQLAPDLAAAAVADQLTPVGIDGHATALTNGRFQTTSQSSVPQSDSIAIDPALMDDLPIATPTALSVRSQRGSIHTAPSDRFLRSEVTVEEKFERLRKEDGFAIGVLNKPSFRKLEISLHNNRIKLTSNAIAFGYQANKPVERSSEAYVRTLDLPETELSDRVEYDMDEQDDFWLEAYNVRRRLREGDAISREIFEITLTKIEKEWAALERRIPKPEKKRQDDPASEDAKCSICDDGECENTNAIVFCDGCNLAVHQECYGVPYIPEGQWLCRKCFASPIDPVSCLFCPAKQGAFKQTSDLHWAHLLCTNWIPEVAVGNPVFMEPIEGVNNIPSSRWKLNCYICKLKVGACIQCSHKACYASFHVTCARRAKLFLQHNPQNPAGLGKTFCDKHLPEWYRAEVDVSASLHAAQQYFLNQGQDEHAPVIGAGVIPRGGGKFTISLKRSKQAAVIPAIVFNEILQYMQKFRIKNKADYIAEMCKYWSLKRRSRRGASLLKRLQIQSEDHTTTKLNAEEKQNKLGFANRLLQEFEQFHRPVLDDLAERENLKREICEMRDGLIEMLYLPLQQILHRVLEALEEADAQSTLARTVPLVEERIPFAITWPKLCRKVEETHYLSVAMFETDFNSMMSGLLDAFPTATKEYKTFLRLQEGSHAILDKARQTERLLQINPESLTATVFDEEYQPHGLQIYEERPWNWANREASPLSEVEDDFVEKIKDGYTDEEYNKRKGELQALLLTSDAQSSEAVTRPALQLPELPAVFSIVQQQREEWASAPVVSTALPARLISHAADLQERLKTIRPATAEQAKPRKRTLSINLKDDPAQPSPDRPRSAPKSRSRPATPLARPLTGSRACAPCKTKKTRCDGHHSRCIKNPNSPFYDPNYEVTLALTPAPLAVAPTSHRKKLPIATSTVASSAALFNAPAPDATSRSGRRLTSAHDRHSDLKVAAAVAEAVTALEVRQKQSATNVSSPSALPEAAAVEADPVAFETSPRAARLAKRVVASDSEVVASGQKRKVEEALEPEQAEAASLNEADNAAAGMPETPTRSSKRARRVYNT